MESKSINSTLFSSSGCLSIKALTDISEGRLTKNQLKIVGKHIQNCAFCKDAVDGLNLHNGLDFLQDIADLKQRWARQSKTGNLFFEYRLILKYTIAAVLLGFGLFLAVWLTSGVKLNYTKNRVILSEEIDIYIKNSDSRIIPFSPKQPAIDRESSAREVFRTEEIIDQPKFIARVENAKITTHEYTEELSAKYSEIEPSRLLKKTKMRKSLVILTSQPPVNGIGVEATSEIPKVYSIVDEMPRFNSKGVNEFRKYVNSQIHYPTEALEKGIEGRLYIQFIVDETGKIIEPRILKGCHPLLEAEVLKIIGNSPKWKPGKQQNIPVKVYLTLPVDFTIAH